MNTRKDSSTGGLRLSLLLTVCLTGLILVGLAMLTAPVRAATCSVPSGSHATIQAAVDDPTCDTITVSGGTYREAVVVDRSLSLRGSVIGNTIIDGDMVRRPLTVTGSGIEVRLANIRIVNGSGVPAPHYGGGVQVAEGATLHGANLQIDHNAASRTGLRTGYGGGLAVVNGAAYLTDTLVLTNTAQSFGTGSGYGGGIYVAGEQGTGRAVLRMVRSEIRDNIAYHSNISSEETTFDSAGGGLYAGPGDEAQIWLSDNTWQNNTARFVGSFPGDASGGAIAVEAPGTFATLVISGDRFLDNTANAALATGAADAAQGGAIALKPADTGRIDATFTDLVFTGNVARAADNGRAAGRGGALYARNSTLRIEGATFNDNLAANTSGLNQRAFGGALYLFGVTMDATRLTVRDNVALQGSGSAAANADSQGGGMVIDGTSIVSITNSVIADNHASLTEGNGAGLYLGANSRASLVHVTVAALEQNPQSGIFAAAPGNPGDMLITNTIVVSHATGILNQGVNGRVAQNYSLFFGNDTDTSAGVAGGTGTVTADPGLLLTNNRPYHIGVESAAINAAVDAGVDSDIDGEDRPQNGGFDIGADELPAPVGVTGAIISGPDGGPPGEYAFAGMYQPVFATLPVSYQWDNGDSTALSTRTLTETGTYTLSLGVTNSGSPGSATVTRTLTIEPPADTCSAALNDVTLTGPISGTTDMDYTFRATASLTRSTSLTYIWAPEPAGGQGTASARYAWSTPGEHTIAVTVQDCARSEADRHSITLTMPPAPGPEQVVYLPAVLR